MKATKLPFWTRGANTWRRVNERGLSVSGPHEPFTASLDMLNLHEAQRLARRPAFDVGFICVMSFDTSWAATLAARFIGNDGYLVSAQNCWNDPTVAAIVGADRAVGLVMSSIQVALWEPGVVARGGKQRRRDSGYDVFFGRVSTTDAFPDACASWSTCSRSSTARGVTDNLWGERWAKLCQNCMGNPVTAIFRHGYIGTCQRPPRARIADQVGVRVSQRRLVPRLPRAAVRRIRCRNMGERVGREHLRRDRQLYFPAGSVEDDWKPSMAQDAHKGRPTEIDEMNGYVLARAGEAGERVPVTAAIIDAVHRFEARGDRSGRCSPGPHTRDGGVLITGLSRPAPRRILTAPSIGKCQPGTVTDGSVVAATQVQVSLHKPEQYSAVRPGRGNLHCDRPGDHRPRTQRRTRSLRSGLSNSRADLELDRYSSLVNPRRRLSQFITSLTGISQGDVDAAPKWDRVAPDLTRFLGDLPIVGHNAEFDTGFLRANGVYPRGLVFDTLDFARVVLPSEPSYGLARLAQKIDASHNSPHRALSDALVTRDLFLELNRLLNEMSMPVLAQLQRMSEQNGWPVGVLASLAVAGKPRRPSDQVIVPTGFGPA